APEPRLAQVRSGMKGATDASACAAPTPRTVSVDVNLGPINYSSNTSLNEFREAAAARNHSGPILGAYQMYIGYKANVDNRARQIAPRRFCVDPEQVIVNVNISRTIQIPKEFASDECLFNLAREYQGQQARADEVALETVRPVLLTVLATA